MPTPRAQKRSRSVELDHAHPGVATSLPEGMAETLTVPRLDLPPTLARTLCPTISIKSMIFICRDHARNVKSRQHTPRLWPSREH